MTPHTSPLTPPLTPQRTPADRPHEPPHERRRERPSGERTRGWSQPQRISFFRACTAAGFNDAQRYIAMRHCGCPTDTKAKRPSVKHARNSNAMFEQVMAIAEAQAKIRGQQVRPPREYGSWRDAAEGGRKRTVEFVRSIISESQDRLPEVFNSGLEGYIVRHTTDADDGELVMVKPTTLDEVDGGQAHRVVEALRAFVGRAFSERGMTPRSFKIPPSALRRTRTTSGATPGA